MSGKGRTIVVTGGYGALGRVVAATASRRGASVAVLDHHPSPPEGVEKECGPNALFVGGVDLSLLEAANGAMAKIKQKFGRIDALLNIAGGFAWQIASEGGADVWDKMFAMNVKTTLNASLAAIPHLIESGAGRIVNVGAQAAVKSAAGMGPYAASKAAVHRMTELMADELKLRGVNVNAVLPSTIDTPANRAAMPKADFSRWVPPEDIAEAMLFLASEASRAITGALIPVTGKT